MYHLKDLKENSSPFLCMYNMCVFAPSAYPTCTVMIGSLLEGFPMDSCCLGDVLTRGLKLIICPLHF